MSKKYAKPVTEVFTLVVESKFCAVSKRFSRFGNPFWKDYGNESWVNEKWTGRKFDDYPFESITIDDDNGGFDSRGKSSLWDDDDM
ncbi:MAG: hypothetical protein IJ562_00840 [Prevotella sp.]|nr:hypothetical protein [Prevotella sp.]